MIRYIVKDIKNCIKYLKYKGALPKNPMHDDIYIVEFPKSGITWVQHILGNIELQLAGLKDECITFYNCHKYLPDVHQLRGSNINRFLYRTFIKSHSEFNPYYYFIIYLIRNPFDVMVSYYNFMIARNYKGTFENFVLSKNFGIMRWKSHVNSWLHKKIYAPRIHFIRYEDLIRNPKNEILNLYKNLGVELDKKILENAIKKSNLESMAKSETHYKIYNPNYNMNFVGKKGKIKKNEILTKSIEKYIILKCEKELKEFYPEFLNG